MVWGFGRGGVKPDLAAGVATSLRRVASACRGGLPLARFCVLAASRVLEPSKVYLRALPRACALDALLRRLAADGWGGFGGVPLVSGSRTRGLCLDQGTTGWSVGGGRVGVAAGLLTGPTVGDVWSGDALDGDGDLWWEACVLEYTRKTSKDVHS